LKSDTTLLDPRFRSFSHGKKTASPALPDCFVGNLLSACRGPLAPIGISSLMVGLIVAARWLEKAGFEAHTGGMAESNRRSCYCRAVYHRTQIIAVSCEISSFECKLCGTTLESWNSSWVPRYRLIAGPVRMPNDSQTP
jgi:methylmalonyl-CoA mutase cobalamin-binding subunit